MKTEQFLQEELQKIHKILKDRLFDTLESGLHFEYRDLDIYRLLNHVNCERIFYFKSKYGDFSFLGLGHSKTIKASELDSFLQLYPEHFLVAALTFESDPLQSSFDLPEWTFVTQNGVTKLLINKSFEYKNFATPTLFFNVNFDLNLYDPVIAPWQSYEEYPEHDQWTEIINTCSELLKSGELEKIVMSRKKIFEYADLIEPIVFFKATMAKNNEAKSCYAIFHQMSFANAYISLTPEKLFSLKDRTFESISLAASAPRGETPQEDNVFEALLTSSDKLTREHMLVTHEIINKIRPLSKSLKVSKLETMKLPYIQHRSIPIMAELLEQSGPLELLALLHPTPAVGGLPWEKARGHIAQLEPYARGLYAAPIGVISGNYSELAVGIRCALIEENKLSIFGGAGIVAGSVSEEEWNETGTKMNPFLKVVNNE